MACGPGHPESSKSYMDVASNDLLSHLRTYTLPFDLVPYLSLTPSALLYRRLAVFYLVPPHLLSRGSAANRCLIVRRHAFGCRCGRPDDERSDSPICMLKNPCCQEPLDYDTVSGDLSSLGVVVILARMC